MRSLLNWSPAKPAGTRQTFSAPGLRRAPDNHRQRPPLHRFRNRFQSLVLTLGFAALASGLDANPFYVSPSGNDSNNGSEATPFRTIERARAAVRSINASQSADIVVYLRAGRYEPADTLRFDGNDSGRNGHRVIYRSYPGEKVSISGGKKVTGWSHYGNGIYRAGSPVSAYRQIYINGQRGTRARTPNSGYNRLTNWNGDRTIQIRADQIHNWSNLNQVEMVIDMHWHQSRLRVGSFSKSGDSANVVPQDPERAVQWNNAWPNREPNQPFYFENSLDFLDQPGEWYLDRGQQQLYYMPRPGENIANAEIIVPRLERLLEIKGASNLDFVGLTFEHTTWTAPDNEGFVPVQSHYYRRSNGIGWIPSGIYLESTQHVRLERNVVRNMGGGGIELAFGTAQTQIVGNGIADMAANGISVYTQLSKPNPPEHEKSRGDVVRNNFVTRAGQDYSGGVAIMGLYTDGLVVEHNEVFNNPYSGLSIGWGWTSNDTALRNNVVRYNRIHQVMTQLDDGAGIYTLSKQPGTLIEENYIHDMTRNPWAGNYEITALYLDEQSEGITLRNNVVRNLSGVNLFKQNQVRDGANSVYNNGANIGNADAIIAKSGLQSAYLDVRDLVTGGSGFAPGPFFGEPAAIPGRIHAEDFDDGGPGVAYHDSVAFNQGGEYRPGEHVDIERCADTGGGFNVGYITAGEWLEYTVDVENAGTYDLLLRVASTRSGRHFHIAFDGVDVTGRIDVPNTGGWQNWETVTIRDVNLQAGEQKMRVRFDSDDLNLNWVEAVAVSVRKPPVVSLTSPAPGSSFEAESPIAIAANASAPDGHLVKVEFFAGQTAIGQKTGNPFSIVWNDAQIGAHAITARATDNHGAVTTSSPVQVQITPKREPFNGAPFAIPGRVVAVEYDRGGPGVAYQDTTPSNTGGGFRPDEHVDIEASANSETPYNIGWVADGEWVEYSVEVAEAGFYDVSFRVASQVDGGHFRMRMNGQDVTGRLDAPNTGGWQNWTTLTLPQVQLTAGKQLMRLCMEGGEFNIGYVDFAPSALTLPPIGNFAEWQQQKFTSAELADPLISGPQADPQGNGVPNLLNYAFIRDPRTSSRMNLPILGRITANGKTYLTFTYTRRPEATDLSYVVETSSDAISWTAAAGNETVQVSAQSGQNVETVVVRDAQPIDSSTKRFLRLQVQQTGAQ